MRASGSRACFRDDQAASAAALQMTFGPLRERCFSAQSRTRFSAGTPQPMHTACRIVLAASAFLLVLAHGPLLHAQGMALEGGGLAAGPLFDELARMDKAV